MDRASGSGVFARDPDAMITLSPSDTRNVTPDQRKADGVSENATACEMEFVLREFAPRHPQKVWFDDCAHHLDKGALKDAKIRNNRGKNRPTQQEKNNHIIKELDRVFKEYPELCDANGGIRITSLVGKLQSLQGEPYKSEKTIRDNTKKLNGKHFRVEKGVIYPVGNENGNGNGSL